MTKRRSKRHFQQSLRKNYDCDERQSASDENGLISTSVNQLFTVCHKCAQERKQRSGGGNSARWEVRADKTTELLRGAAKTGATVRPRADRHERIEIELVSARLRRDALRNR